MDDLCCLRAAFTRQFNLFCQDRDGIRRNPNASRRNSAVVYNKRSAEGMATCRLIMKPLSLIEQLGLGLLSTTREETKFSLVHIVAIIPPSVINDALRNVIESPLPPHGTFRMNFSFFLSRLVKSPPPCFLKVSFCFFFKITFLGIGCVWAECSNNCWPFSGGKKGGRWERRPWSSPRLPAAGYLSSFGCYLFKFTRRWPPADEKYHRPPGSLLPVWPPSPT